MTIITTNHAEIINWTVDNNGLPAHVPATSKSNDIGVLRILFNNTKVQKNAVTPIAWGQFFDKFEEQKLALLYDPKTRFYKLIKRK